ncbi:HD domain-containing protein [Bacillus cereus group sp. BceL212]|uniref:HD domain-containing protein n=1 Tax=Bacillus cereus group sp. BceL212 TaxID=3445018 RepID=UPI003F1F803D
MELIMLEKNIGPLMEKVADYRNIHLAYLRTKNNYMNKELYNIQEIELFRKAVPYIYDDIRLILKGEKEHSFRPLEVLNKPKQKDKKQWLTRPIARMNFFDAVIIQAVINVLAEEMRYMLPNSNFGYNLNKPMSENIYQFWKYGYAKFVNEEINSAVNERYRFVVEADIENFYPSIDNQLLIKEIISAVSLDETNNDFINWLDRILNIQRMSEDGEKEKIEGLPQGPLYSPLLALFYIRKILDVVIKEYPYVRAFSYVDDIRIYCETKEEAEEIIEKLSIFLNSRRLKLNKTKSKIYKVDERKKLETKIMGKASNLDRAIRDEVILSSQDKEQMRERLNLLMKELNEIYKIDEMKEKLEERLEKFVDYRVIKLLDNEYEEWEANLIRFVSLENLGSNFIAMWHALYVSATTINQKRLFLQKLEVLLEEEELQELSYVKYIIFSYIFRWSPVELKYSREKITAKLKAYIVDNSPMMLKAILTNMHPDWTQYLLEYKEYLKCYSDIELQNLLYVLNVDSEPGCNYSVHFHENRLYLEGESDVFHTSTSFNLEANYLETEKFKKINYKIFNQDNNGTWRCEFNNSGVSLIEASLNDYDVKLLLTSVASWLDFQFKFSDERIPCSVINPEYIYINKELQTFYLYGNPVYENDIYFSGYSNKIWKESCIKLFEVLFKIDLRQGINIFDESKIIKIWQYRILRKLFDVKFEIHDFIKFIINVINYEENDAVLSLEQFQLDKILGHYIKDFNSLDNLFLISMFVEGSWKNGAKECNFYTLHNHEHARYLIKNIHEIFKKSDFSIYINSKEAFRLFAACYLHDVGMLSAPENKRLIDLEEEDIKRLVIKVGNIVKKSNSMQKNKKVRTLNLPYIYDIHTEVEKVREGIVRNEHPFVSEKELVSDYPQLPLTVAERRDIGIMSAAHGQFKSSVNKINEVLHDGSQPIRLKLLSLLLRLADLSDVSKERVRKEILERNYKRMDDVSIFHWIKHLSVNNLEIKTIRNKEMNRPVVVQLSINHNFLPSGKVEQERLKNRCGSNCKLQLEDDGLMGSSLDGFYREGKKHVMEGNSDFKYFEENNCNLTCAFVNQSYNWFYAEIIYLNMYLKQNNINVQFDLNLKLDKNVNKDFYYVYNRNDKHSAQEFMHEFF